MDETTPEVPKGEGRGRGRWTERGAQATQQGDIDQLKELVAEMAGRLDELEATSGGIAEDPPVEGETVVDDSEA